MLKQLLFCCFFSLAVFILRAQGLPVVLEAEAGTVGADYAVLTEAQVTYVAPQTDLAGSDSPVSAAKVITFSVKFSQVGSYDLYARVRVGSGLYSDDSFYYGNGFGAKPVGSAADWIRVNGIAATGTTEQSKVITGGGNAGGQVWKWINLSKFTGDEAPITFVVTDTELTYTFQYGSRENGLDLDKLAFGRADLYYTVQNLDRGEAGSETMVDAESGYPAQAYEQVKTYVNPVMPGDHPDLTLLKVGNDFYSSGSSFQFTPYLPIMHSTDLVHWQEISRVIPSNWSALISDAPQQGIWQGAITYFYGSYWIYFSNTAGGGQYFSKAASPAGPWSVPVKMNTTTTTGASGYDNSVFVDDDGTPYLLIKPGKNTNRIQKIGLNGHLTDEVINLDWVNADNKYSWAEGPVMCKRDGWYYYFIAGNIFGGQWVLRSRTLTADPGSWEELGNFFAPITDAATPFRGPNHITQPFQLQDGTWWTLSHSYASVNGNDWRGQGRQGLLHQVTWDANGKPTGSAPTASPLTKPNLPTSGIPWKLPRADFFDSNTLALSWHFLNKTAAQQYSLTDRSGWLRLKPTTGRSHILQKEGTHYHELVTRVDLDATSTAHAAGIYLANGNESVQVRLYSGYAGGKRILFSFNNITFEANNTVGNVVWLKLERKEHTLFGYFSADGISWTPVGSGINVADLDKEQPNYNWWVGNSMGLFAEGKNADFDLFLYKDGFSALPVAGYNNFFGVEPAAKAVGKVVTNSTANGGWLLLGGVSLGNSQRVSHQVEVTAAAHTGGNLEVWLDDLATDGGRLLATIPITATGSEDTWQTFRANLSVDVAGQHDVYLRFPKVKNAFYLNTIRFISKPVTTTGIKPETDDSWLTLFPIPFQNVITVELKEGGQGSYIITDLTGRQVESGNIRNGQVAKVGAKLPPAVYVIRVEANRKITSRKLTKTW